MPDKHYTGAEKHWKTDGGGYLYLSSIELNLRIAGRDLLKKRAVKLRTTGWSALNSILGFWVIALIITTIVTSSVNGDTSGAFVTSDMLNMVYSVLGVLAGVGVVASGLLHLLTNRKITSSRAVKAGVKAEGGFGKLPAVVLLSKSAVLIDLRDSYLRHADLKSDEAEILEVLVSESETGTVADFLEASRKLAA
jgi:hypothetical protein